MDHADHVRLLRPAIPAPAPGAVWADIGAGTGAFTRALADLLGPGATVIAVDRDRSALEANSRAVGAAFPATEFASIVADFRGDLASLPPLDGFVAANSLHFARADQIRVIASLAARLQLGGAFVVVEYDSDDGNQWVPHAFSARSWPALAEAAGLVSAHEIGRVPSRFLGAIYSAIAHRPGD